MSIEFLYALTFATAALTTVGILVLAIARGRQRPTRMWAWITGLVIACLGTASHLMLAGGIVASATDTPWWLLLGSTALVSATVMAFVRPRWAAWVFAVSAVAIPAVLAVIEITAPATATEVFPAAAVAAFYSPRVLLTALFLWIATIPIRGARPPASPSPVPRSESVPIG